LEPLELLKNIDPDTALELVLSEARLGATETVSLSDSLNRVLAETVVADRDYPPFDRAMMDGYAVRIADTGRRVSIVGEVAAGQPSSLLVEPGTCVAIMTGAACPAGTEAVEKKERGQREGNSVLLPADIENNQHVVRKGQERQKGTVVLDKGMEITSLAIAAFASVGRKQISVIAAPRLAVITTGRELVLDDAEPQAYTIRDSNGVMLAAQIRQLGLPEPFVMHAEDTAESLASALERASEADLILFTGGVSKGRYDLVPDAVRDYGATVVFHKVTQKPGKPLLFAKTNRTLIFGLPGNPMSTHCCFHRYVAAAIKKIMGKSHTRCTDRARLASDLTLQSNRTLFHQGRVERDGDSWRLSPRTGRGSADFFSATDCTVYLRFPPGRHHLPAGTEVAFEWMDGYPR
jgi:molybdopterin molybdotransferase